MKNCVAQYLFAVNRCSVLPYNSTSIEYYQDYYTIRPEVWIDDEEIISISNQSITPNWESSTNSIPNTSEKQYILEIREDTEIELSSTPGGFENGHFSTPDSNSTIDDRPLTEIRDKNVLAIRSSPVRADDVHLATEAIQSPSTTIIPENQRDEELVTSMENIPLVGIDYTIPTKKSIETWMLDNHNIHLFKYVFRRRGNPCIAMNLDIIILVNYLKENGEVINVKFDYQ